MNRTRRFSLLVLALAALATTSPRTVLAFATPFSIHWTAPGDDGAAGRAASYDLRYSIRAITASNFSQATRITGLPLPAPAGTVEHFVVTGLPDGVVYYLALRTSDRSGNWSGVSNVMTHAGLTTGVTLTPVALSLSAPWPNPARASVQWTWSAPTSTDLQLDVYDISGRHLQTVASGEQAAGTGDVSWDLRDGRGMRVDPGLYFVRARLGTTRWTQRVTVVR